MKNNKDFVVPLLITIIALLIIGGGYYIYKQNNNKVVEVQPSNTTNVLGNTGADYTPPKDATNNPKNDLSVKGMSKYTDSSFGFSFWYPSSMNVTVAPITNDYSSYMYGVNTKVLKTILAPEFRIDEVYSPDTSILSSTDAGPLGSHDNKYFFNFQTHTWMYFSDGSPTGKNSGTSTADVSYNTMGGLHIFNGYTRFGTRVIIPLTAHNFLTLYSKCNDATDYLCSQGNGLDRFNKAVKTILATDPLVATPVSQSEQIKAIQAEADAYVVK